MKTILVILLALLGLEATAQSRQTAPLYLSGTVFSEEGLPLPGALVYLLDTDFRTITDEEGAFSLQVPEGAYTLTVSYIGMHTHRMELVLPLQQPLRIQLEPQALELGAVEIVSTGYQSLPKERATGSFVFLDSQLVQRKVSANILDRLEDVTSGLIFNRGPQAAGDPITIRGRSTIYANSSPLIIVDNFPYDGPIENINPNDVASISVLKDAAAASIWGARAGNGVIVITTHRGRTGQPLQVSLNANVTLTEPRDLDYVPQMSMSDFVDIEQYLFGRNFYRSQENNANKPALSPAVETMIALRDKKISQQEADARMARYRQSDIRRDITDHYLQPALGQQYALSLSGGGKSSAYQVSLGYDHNRADILGNGRSRWTLATGNSWKAWDDRLEAGIQVNLAHQNSSITTVLPSGFPYERLSDESGSPLVITNTYSTRYLESVKDQGLLDWTYAPLDEIRGRDYQTEAYDLRITPHIRYAFGSHLKLGLYYQFWRNLGNTANRDPQALFYTRDQINKYTQSDADGTLSYPVPVGDILSVSQSGAFSHTFRPQLEYKNAWAEKHFLNFLAGAELRDLQGENHSTRYYGYSDDMGTSLPVDRVGRYPFYYNPGQQGAIISGESHGGNTDRFVSYYANVGYDFEHRYFLTGSIRKDQANIFGVEANMRGVPLWSVGGAWIISEELFADRPKMPFLKLRLTYGSAGNVDKGLSADVTAQYVNFQFYDVLPSLVGAVVVNPPNPALRWEKVNTTNLALDLETQNGFLSASAEYYRKHSRDLLGEYSVPASSGMTSFTGNFAETQVRGVDLTLSARWFRGAFGWTSILLHSSLGEEVLDFEKKPTINNLLATASSPSAQPIVGRPLYGIYTYQWAGLDPQAGNPMGYLNGEPSMDYLGISRAATIDNLQYHGPARPTSFGSLRNELSYRGFSLSLNISYRLGYHYKRKSIDYFTLLRGEIGHGDFDKRWQSPGDEAHTQVPSLPATADTRRNAFYSNSAILVERGDHIRLNDVRLAYTWDRGKYPGLPFRSLQVYGYAGNLGLLWKASNDSLDPDYQSSKALRTFSTGLKIDF